jgi:antitoxin component of MazEF toxin-antitoxin module
MLTIVRLTRNGNSTTVCIPKTALDHLQWLPGEHVAMSINDNGTVTLVRVNMRELVRAADLAHAEIVAAAPVV